MDGRWQALIFGRGGGYNWAFKICGDHHSSISRLNLLVAGVVVLFRARGGEFRQLDLGEEVGATGQLRR